ncbi:TolC family protein [Pseudomonas sp. NPDC007930]|uniref:TolC family protein n=1 Tax=Pseudomonas sp. NPDC007930 TaxID=3364417 RepID=UPI0036E2621F
MPYRSLLPLLLAAPLTALAAPLPLDQVLKQAGDGPGVAAADAEFQARQAIGQQRDAETGWEAFASAGVGRYNELVTSDVRDNYYGRNYAIGVRYPLLGALQRRVQALHEASRDARISEIDRDLARARQHLALRSSYADWWRATQEQQLCQGASEAQRQALATVDERLRDKWILPSDAQLMRSEWTAVARRCEMQADLLADTRAALASLGVSVQPGDTPVAEPLAEHPKPLTAWQDLLESNPRMAQRQAQLSSAEQDRKRPWYTAIDSYFSVSGSREERNDSSEAGSGLSAGVTFSAPLDLLDYGSARQHEGEQRYQAALRGLENERATLLRELGKVLEQQRRNFNEYVWRSERREALDNIITERRQRTALDAGEASLRLLQAQVDHYNAGFAQISAWHAVWLQDSALRLFSDDSPDFAQLMGADLLRWQAPLPPGSDSPPSQGLARWTQGVYVWNSQPLLDASQRPGQLAALQRAQITELNLGLNAVQVANAATTRGQLQALLRDAHAKGLKVNLLLGDPSWIKPSQRPALLGLIGQFKALPFDALHLDLEVEQLGWPVPDERLRDWLATLRAAKQASPWPLRISSHPRWFAEEAGRQPCVPCELPGVGVEQVSLMIYTRNPQNSARRAAELAKRWPRLHMRLAQSIEADQPADLSWHDAPAPVLQRQARDWGSTLAPANVGGIDWQSWNDYPSAP